MQDLRGVPRDFKVITMVTSSHGDQCDTLLFLLCRKHCTILVWLMRRRMLLLKALWGR